MEGGQMALVAMAGPPLIWFVLISDNVVFMSIVN